ncbi:acetyltransferase [Phenylobacterium sp.]|uniref:GNAT family N-acetyltransferase n=1 Tax=Phenylobacterium sp. TaxID=1871053 RepID=UPI002BCDDE29|nr:acetyltransferase [Phenylobacterium sp.]HLZ75208.1 acetyltransferase [Phenylobacterium sp.]
MADVTLHIVEPAQKPVLENLFQLYTHDFSDFWGGREEGELQEDGRFAPYPYLDSYWTDTDRTPLFIRTEGFLAGFALLNRFSHSGLPVDHAVAEFWIARKHRRFGVGLAGAVKILGHRPGQWEMAVARRNTGALPFWRRVAAEVAGSQVDEIDRDDDLWNGPIVRCRV